ncbi:DEAD/DEAH box helicase [Virgibacillus flavescens]|uniref:DEAD/DEAH box helicase n=1 Tax=Virgibacillus flavescens TaxID=1611422 RepID=UPI003D34B3D6
MDFINYFRNSLIDGERYATRYNEIADQAIYLSPDSITEGRVSVDTKEFFSAEQTAKEVLINPLLLQKESNEVIAPLWIPANLLPTGELVPHPRDIPWMSHYYLSPSPSGETSVGYMEDYEKFFSNRSFHFQNWQEYITFAADLFSYVTGHTFHNFSHQYYEKMVQGALSIKRDNTGNKMHLISILDDLKNKTQEELPSLFRRFISFNEEEKEEINFQSSYYSSHNRHLGHLPGTDSLSTSQRQALTHFFEKENGSILALNGPPGTGKSMLLTSIMASFFVESAIDQQDAPPLLVATAHDHFTAIDLAEDYLVSGNRFHEKRWIPGMDSYSLYASTDYLANMTVPHYSENNASFKKNVESQNYAEHAENVYLENAAQYFNRKSGSIKEAVNSLHDELTTVVLEIRSACRILNNDVDKEIQQWLQLQNVGTGVKEDMADILDTHYRTKAFSLAARYWEGRWLMEHVPQKNVPFMDLMQSIRKITPLLVVPIHQLPVFFKASPSQAPAYECIDWLLIEEAGQLLPEVAAAAVAFTKNILAIGDVQQVKPQWNITKTFDFANIVNSGWEEENGLLEPQLIHSGFAASSGSMLRVSQRMSAVRMHPDMSGLFLTEHRRSVPEVIRYCNELVYHNWLQSVRPSIKKYPLPHLGILDVKGEVTQHKGGLSNKKEANRIIDWMKENKKQLQSYYETEDLSSVIAIVTPFPEQKELLEQLLDEHLFNGFTVGTIHMMQGASRPVILFSSVYQKGTSEHLNFDEDESFLNVAVSRAEDSFLVFGDINIFQKERNSPSSLLMNYLEEL